MAKEIKFNLICDGVPIRTIEELQDNFSIEDILAYYENGLLQRWLRVRGYQKEYDEVSEITCKEPIELIKQLISIFQVESDEKKVSESIYILEYLKERKELITLYERGEYKIETIINDYEAGYRQCVVDILDHPEDVGKIKSSIAGMVKNYKYLLQLNHRRLFYALIKHSYLAVMCLLMNEQTRKYYLPVITISDEGETIDDTKANTDKKMMYDQVCRIISESGFAEKLGDNLHIFSGRTDGYWKDLEPKGKKYMILSMEAGNFVRSSGVNGGDLGYNDVHNQFILTDGIDYKSNSTSQKLLYMEV